MELTQSAVSRQLQLLEAYLDAEPVNCDRKKLSLTKAGQDYVQEIRPALSQIAQVASKLHVSPVEGH